MSRGPEPRFHSRWDVARSGRIEDDNSDSSPEMTLDAAISRTQRWFADSQAADGYWVGELDHGFSRDKFLIAILNGAHANPSATLDVANLSNKVSVGEYYALTLFALAGMILMAMATDLLVIFLALEILSLAVFKHFPQVQKVKAGLLFVVANDFVKADFHARDEFVMWRPWFEDTSRLEKALELDVWNPRPNFSCKGWCPVTDCTHWEPKRNK